MQRRPFKFQHNCLVLISSRTVDFKTTVILPMSLNFVGFVVILVCGTQNKTVRVHLRDKTLLHICQDFSLVGWNVGTWWLNGWLFLPLGAEIN